MNTDDSSARYLRDESFTSTIRRLEESMLARTDRTADNLGENSDQQNNLTQNNDLSDIISIDRSKSLFYRESKLPSAGLPPEIEEGNGNISFSDILPELDIPELALGYPESVMMGSSSPVSPKKLKDQPSASDTEIKREDSPKEASESFQTQKPPANAEISLNVVPSEDKPVAAPRLRDSVAAPKLKTMLEKLSKNTTTLQPLSKFFARRKFLDTIQAKIEKENPVNPNSLKLVGDHGSSIDKTKPHQKLSGSRKGKKPSKLSKIKKKLELSSAKIKLMANLRASRSKSRLKNSKIGFCFYWCLEWISTICSKMFSKVLEPDSKTRIIWDIFTVIFILYQMFIVPFHISFSVETSPAWRNIDIAVDCFFIVDIFLSFQTGYYAQGLLVKKRKEIARHYVKQWFFFDVLASFPYDWIAPSDAYAVESSSATSIVKTLKILALLRVMKLTPIVSKIETYIEISVFFDAILGFFKLSLIILVIAHWIACSWHLVGKALSRSYASTWLTQIYLNAFEGWYDEYVFSFYWATITMISVGYGDIVPITSNEKIFAIFVMILASGVIAFNMSSINNILQQMDQNKYVYKRAVVSFNAYMKSKNVSHDVKIKVRRYLEHVLGMYQDNKMNENNLFSLLSDKLKNELVIDVNGKILKSAKCLIDNFTKVMLVEATLLMKEAVFSSGEFICREDLLDDCSLYILHHGEADVMAIRSKTVFTTISVGGVFGEYSFFTGAVRELSIRSKNFTVAYKMPRDDFTSLLEFYPLDQEKFCMIKDKIMIYRDFSAAKLPCLTCEGTTHLTTECPSTHYIVDQKWHVGGYLDAMSAFRKRFIRIKSRKNYELQKYSELEDAAQCIREDYPHIVREYKLGMQLSPSDFAALRAKSGKKKEQIMGRKKSGTFGSIIDDSLREKIAMSLQNTKFDYQNSKAERLRKNEKFEQDMISEVAENFKYYFPHNNIEVVLVKLVGLLNKNNLGDGAQVEKHEAVPSTIPLNQAKKEDQAKKPQRRKSIWGVVKGAIGPLLEKEAANKSDFSIKDLSEAQLRRHKDSIHARKSKVALDNSPSRLSRKSIATPNRELGNGSNTLKPSIFAGERRLSNREVATVNDEPDAGAQEEQKQEDRKLQPRKSIFLSGQLFPNAPHNILTNPLEEVIERNKAKAHLVNNLISEESKVEASSKPKHLPSIGEESLKLENLEQTVSDLVKKVGVQTVVEVARTVESDSSRSSDSDSDSSSGSSSN